MPWCIAVPPGVGGLKLWNGGIPEGRPRKGATWKVRLFILTVRGGDFATFSLTLLPKFALPAPLVDRMGPYGFPHLAFPRGFLPFLN